MSKRGTDLRGHQKSNATAEFPKITVSTLEEKARCPICNCKQEVFKGKQNCLNSSRRGCHRIFIVNVIVPAQTLLTSPIDPDGNVRCPNAFCEEYAFGVRPGVIQCVYCSAQFEAYYPN